MRAPTLLSALRTGVVIAAALLALGCARLKTDHVLVGVPGSPHSGQVRIAMEGAPEPTIEEVAILQVAASGHKSDLPHLVEALTKEAQRLGCDAVVRVRLDKGATQATVSAVAGRILGPDITPPQPGQQYVPPQPVAPPAIAAPVGCSNDMDCKGDRVCEKGKCVASSGVDI